MKENDLHHLRVETCWLEKDNWLRAENNWASYFDCQWTTSASKNKNKLKNHSSFILSNLLQTGGGGEKKKETIQQQFHHSSKWKSDETRVNLRNANQELLTWINLLEHYRARALISQPSSENGDKHCHFFFFFFAHPLWKWDLIHRRSEISNIYYARRCNWYLEMGEDEMMRGRDRD